MYVESNHAHLIAYSPIGHIQFEVATINKFIKAFSKYDMIPTQVTEILLPNPAGNRLRLVNKDGSTSIYFWTNRIEIVCLPKTLEQTIEKDGFSLLFEKAIALLKECGQFLETRYNRISLIGEGVLDSGTAIEQLAVFRRYNKTYSQRIEGTPAEWNIRNVFKERLPNRNEEIINNINAVEFFSGLIQLPEGQKPISGYKYHIDVNTAPENSTPRFSLGIDDNVCEDLLKIWEASRNSFLVSEA